MILMSRFRGLRPAIWLLSLPLLLEAACSRPVDLRSDQGSAQAGQPQAPFQDGSAADSARSTLTPIQEHSAVPENALPFRDDQNLPAGTLLTVRLKSPISAENPAASGTFEAIVDEPLIVDGNTLVPRGASVEGRVESARAFKSKGNRAYVRLILNSIDLAGRNLPVQTSSLFARGALDAATPAGAGNSAPAVYLERGRRLTFRLTEPVYLASQRPNLAH